MDPKNYLTVKETKTSAKRKRKKRRHYVFVLQHNLNFYNIIATKSKMYSLRVYLPQNNTHTHSEQCIWEIVWQSLGKLVISLQI